MHRRIYTVWFSTARGGEEKEKSREKQKNHVLLLKN
jgi:hypothetical protein